jgi:hypothetical protein
VRNPDIDSMTEQQHPEQQHPVQWPPLLPSHSSPPGGGGREAVTTTSNGASRPLEREDSGAGAQCGGQESSAGLADWSAHGAADAIAAPEPKAAAKTTSPHGVPEELREFFDFGDDDDDETARSFPGGSGSASEADSQESEDEEDWFHMERRRTSSSGSRRPSLELPRL